MKENIFDVLIFLFENYLDDDMGLLPFCAEIKTELLQAGFQQEEVNSAFDWLETLTEQTGIKPGLTSAFRIFCPQEEIKLDIECRSFLLFLEHSGILTANTREIVIDRAMAIENARLTLDELKWTVLMVLLSQSDNEVAFSRMEDLIYDLTPTLLH
jgi:Smg protein